MLVVLVIALTLGMLGRKFLGRNEYSVLRGEPAAVVMLFRG